VLVTSVVRKPHRAGRVDVYVDGKVAFDVARDAARKMNLRPGRAIENAEVEAIVAADQERSALDAAVVLLARRPRSERELRRRLAQRKFAPQLVEGTIERLRALDLIDDAAFARYWADVRDRTSPRGRRLVTQELRAQGVDMKTAAEAASELSDDDAAYRLASRRARSMANLEYDAFRNRLASLLRRRGFGWEVVRATIERCWSEVGEPLYEDDRASVME
jgi:regulatory protein